MKCIRVFIASLLFSLSLAFVSAVEIRSLWVTPWNLTSPEQIDELVSDALENNQNEILAEVRYRADALYIPNKSNAMFNNPEPRSYILPSNDFDPLEYLLEKAHSVGISVQAWVSVLNVTPTNKDRLRTNYIYQNHSNWIMTDAYGRRMNGNNYMGNFIDPGILEVRSHLLNVMLDIVANYPTLDGFHLDYIRYPAIQYGHSGESLRRYKESCLSAPMTWNEWRIKQVTDLVREFRERSLLINPRLLITAAVFANLNDAEYDYAQDWTNWLDEGMIDRAYPMAYAKQYNTFQRVLENIADKTDRQKVVIGLRAWQENFPRIDYKVEQIIDKARLSRQMRFAGIALFSYEGVKKSEFFPELTAALYDWVDPGFFFTDDDDFIASITTRSGLSTNADTLVNIAPNNPIRSIKILEIGEASSVKSNSGSYIDSILLEGNIVIVTIYLDKEDKWMLEMYDETGNSVFKSSKVYPRGFYTEEGAMTTMQTDDFQQGIYTLRLSNKHQTLVSEKKFMVN